MTSDDEIDGPGWILRPPRTDEVETLARLHITCWRQAYAHLLPRTFFDDLLPSRRAIWTSLLAHDLLPERLIVAEHRDQPGGFALAGTAMGSEPVREHQLYSLYLDAAHHGSGIGQALLDAVLGTLPAQLWVAAENPRARAFYARNGFDPDGARHIDTETPDLEEIRLVR